MWLCVFNKKTQSAPERNDEGNRVIPREAYAGGSIRREYVQSKK